jgi:muramoyltetrapeptide carboxypeptidase
VFVIPVVVPWAGSSAGVIAPANSMCEVDPRVIAKATERLRQKGFAVKIAPFSAAGAPGMPAALEQRLADLDTVLEDSAVSIVWPVYGGYNGIDLLPHLPLDRIRARRQVWVGFSDTTALLNVIAVNTGLVTFHGPSFAALGDPGLHPVALDVFWRAVMITDGSIAVEDPGIAAEDLWWKSPSLSPRHYRPNQWETYRAGVARGRLFGGNASTLLALAGTAYFPPLAGAILLLEHSPETPPGEIHRDFAQLAQLGALDSIAGLIIGRPGAAAAARMPEILDKHCRRVAIPILFNTNCSHVDPIVTLPIGADVTLDAENRVIRYTAVAVS